MEKDKAKRGWPQFYGYMVCLIAVIAFLISTGSLVNNLVDRQDPLNAGWQAQGQPSLASFENYKMDILKSGQGAEVSSQAYVPDEASLRGMYEAARTEKIQRTLHSANKQILVNGITIAISVILFLTHWGWLRKLDRKAPA